MTILAGSNAHRLSKRDFYEKLNETSYYNSYLRIKDELIERNIIELSKRNGGGKSTTFISLTPKGEYMFRQLSELDALLNHDN